jgi:hypothetical protein
MTEAPSFTCPDCGAISWNRNDVEHGYCGRCHAFTGHRDERTTWKKRDDDVFWERLGDQGGLPTHLPIGVNEYGQGPTDPEPAHHYTCWCGDLECPLALALQHAWLAGRRKGHQDANAALVWLSNDPDWEGQAPSMGFMASVDQELTERPGYARRQLSQGGPDGTA